MLKKINPTKTSSWKELERHYKKMKSLNMKSLFEKDKNQFDKFSIRFNGIFFDYSKNIIDSKTIKLLITLAEETGVKDAIKKMFAGDKINETEKRSVLHIALRNLSGEAIVVDGKNIMPEIESELNKMFSFSEKIRNREWKGYTNKPITDIVNIGIGGSELGPNMICEALKFYATDKLNIHFVSNIDSADIFTTLENLNHETTLFMVASKSFSTEETITNGYSAKEWFLKFADDKRHMSKHFVALSSNEKKVSELGIDRENMFGFWNFVGGRYSLWSAIGLSIACFIGFENFTELLKGANEMDEHFAREPFDKNIPVILALIGIWYNNFFKAGTEAIFPYDHCLRKLPAYLQQANMESNGKSVDRNGDQINYPTCPVVWGESGIKAQHAFFQLLHQGTQLVPATLIASITPLIDSGNRHKILMANFLAQSEAFMKGGSEEEIDRIPPYKIMTGNKPTNSIILDKLTPKILGSLIAMYEHKIFVQGVIWNIFSFDQWGVELGKELSIKILPQLKTGVKVDNHDSSTNGLINLINRK